MIPAFFLVDPPSRTTTPAGLRAPEQTLNLGLDQKTDIWSFGCLLYETLTGTALFPIMDFAFSPPQVTEDEHMIYLITALGPLPPEIQDRWLQYDRYFDSEGRQIRFSVEADHPPESDYEGSSDGTSNPDHERSSDGGSVDTDREEHPQDQWVRQSLEEKFMEYKMDEIDECESKVILDLLRKILVYKAQDRPSASELLQHPWFAEIA